MRSHSGAWRSAAVGLLVACACQLAAGQSNQEWIAYKQKCGISAGTAYNDWVAAGSHCNAGSATPAVGTGSAEQLGTTLGNNGGDMMIKGFQGLFRPAPPKLAPQIDASQQRALAAQQLNNSGIYLLNRKPRDYAGAINEFQKALEQTPNDAMIAANLRYAKQLQKESAAAGQTSNMLGSVLGSPAASSGKASYSPLDRGFSQRLQSGKPRSQRRGLQRNVSQLASGNGSVLSPRRECQCHQCRPHGL